MRSALILSMVLAAAGTAGAEGEEPQVQKPESLGDAVVAAVDDSYYTTAEYLWDLQNTSPTRRKEIAESQPQTNELVNNWVQDEVTYKKALEEGLDKDPAVVRMLERAKRSIILQAYREKALDISIEVSDEEARQYFSEHPAEFFRPGSVRVRRILVATEDEAKSLLAELKDNPSKFEETARKLSLDAGSRQLGGDLGELSREDVNAAFGQEAEQTLFEAELDALYGPYKSDDGWSVIKLVGRKKPITVDAERGAELAKRKLGARRYQEAYLNAMNELRRERRIYVNEEVLKKIAEGALPGAPRF